MGIGGVTWQVSVVSRSRTVRAVRRLVALGRLLLGWLP